MLAYYGERTGQGLAGINFDVDVILQLFVSISGKTFVVEAPLP